MTVILDLPCDTIRNDTTNSRAKDISSTKDHASFGDSVTSGTFPTKYSDQRGYTFDGVDDYFSGLTTPTGSYTISILKRVAGVLSVTHENDLTTWDTLISSGQFTGDILSIRVHDSVLTGGEQTTETTFLKNRFYADSLPSGLLSSLVADGTCVLYHDYRSSSFHDWSDNNNNGSSHASTVWNTDSLDVSSGNVVVPDSAELQSTEGCIVVFADFQAPLGTEYFVAKNDAGGTQYTLFSETPNIYFYDGTSTRSRALVPTGKKCIAVNYLSGSKCEAFADGSYIGLFNDTSTVTVNDADITIGSTYSGIANCLSPIHGVLIFNRKLTAEEHKRLYEELWTSPWENEIHTHETVDLSSYVKPTDPSRVLAIDMNNIRGTVYDYSGRENNGTASNVSNKITQLGTVSVFDGSTSYISVDDDDTLDLTTTLTISAWVKTTTAGIIAAKWTSAGNQRSYTFSTDGTLKFWLSLDGIANEIEVGTTDIEDGLWHHVAVVFTSPTVSFYIDGVLDGDVRTFSTQTSAFPGTSVIKIGDQFVDSQIADLQVFSSAKPATWVAAQYQLGLPALFKTNFGAQESISDETSGSLSNTPFVISTGTWQIDTATIDNKPCKVLNCIVAGNAYLTTIYLNQSTTEAAYGTWEFWLYNNTTSTQPEIFFIDDGSGNGYSLLVDSDERIYIVDTPGYSNLIQSDTGIFPIATWTKVTIKRSAAGIFSLYLDDVLVDDLTSGANPSAADTTYTESNRLTMTLDAGDKVAFSDPISGHSIIKKLTS